MERMKEKQLPSLIVDSLAPQENSILSELLSTVKVVVSDVDYTLFDFEKGHVRGQRELGRLLGQRFSDEVDRLFRLTLEGQRKPTSDVWDQRDEFDAMTAQIKKLQRSFVPTYGIKVFSREAEIILAARALHVSLTKELVEVGRDAYWSTLGKSEAIYPDARPFISFVHNRQIPLILMSGSDSICQVRADFSLDYDPAVSRAYKHKRFQHLGFPYADAVFGDPYDKPDPRFFETVFATVEKQLGYMPAKEKILFVGDSLRNDLEVPHQQGCTTILIKSTV